MLSPERRKSAAKACKIPVGTGNLPLRISGPTPERAAPTAVKACESGYEASDPHGLTRLERAFVAAFWSTARLNATKAARLAGYSAGGSYGALRVSAHRLLHRPRVRQAFRDAERQLAARQAAFDWRAWRASGGSVWAMLTGGDGGAAQEQRNISGAG